MNEELLKALADLQAKVSDKASEMSRAEVKAAIDAFEAKAKGMFDAEIKAMQEKLEADYKAQIKVVQDHADALDIEIKKSSANGGNGKEKTFDSVLKKAVEDGVRCTVRE